MAAWQKWFASIADSVVDNGGHFSVGREISKDGVKTLPMEMSSISGYTIIRASTLDEAEHIAKDNPFISSIRVYEIISK